jgi:hypothetical protein
MRGPAVLAVLTLAACAGTQPPPPAKAPPAAAAAHAPAPAAAPPNPGVPEGPPVTLLPAATARAILEASVSITSVDALLTKGATLVGQAVPLPIDPTGLRDMLLSQAGLGPEVAANLDLASPSGAAVVATGRAGGGDLVMAVAARGPAEAERVIAALGKPVMKRGAVVLVDNGSGGRGWVFRAGNVVVLSDDLDALTRGAMLALEARHATTDDVSAVIYPEAIAQANGTDVKSALAAAVAAFRAGQPPPGAPRAPDYSVEAVADVMQLLGDLDTVEMGLSVDPARGMFLQAHLRPRAGTPLAAVAHDVRPFALERALLGGSAAPAALGAMSYGPIIQNAMARQRERLATPGPDAKKKKAAASALAAFDAMLAALDGQASFAFPIAREPPHLAVDVSYPLKDAAAAAKLAAALGKLDRAAALALWETYTGPNPAYEQSASKESVGKLKAIRYTMTMRGQSEPDTEGLRKMLGKTTEAYLAVAGTHLLFTLGGNAKARLAGLAAGKPGANAPSGSLADALAAGAGREGIVYLNLAPVVATVATYAQDPRAASMGRSAALPIPLYAIFGGDGVGKAWTFDLTLPLAAFKGAAPVIQKMGAGGLPPVQ